jgi:hypothetical protein
MDLEQRLAAARARRDAALKTLAPKHRGGEVEEFRSAQQALLAVEREIAASKNEEHAVPLPEPLALVEFKRCIWRVAALRGAVNDEKALREAAEQLRSEFVTLETRIASRKKSVWGAVRDQAKLATGTVVAGLGLWMSHVLSPTWTGIAAAVGGIPAAQRVGSEPSSSMRRTPDEMTHPLYFLWKVKRAGRRGL